MTWAATPWSGGLQPELLLDYVTDVGASGGVVSNVTRSIDTETWGTPTLRCTPTSASNFLARTAGSFNYRRYEAFMLEYYVQDYRADGRIVYYQDEGSGINRYFVHTINNPAAGGAPAQTMATAWGKQNMLVRFDQSTSDPGPYLGVSGTYPSDSLNSVAGWAVTGGALGSRNANLTNMTLVFENFHQGPNTIWLKAIYGCYRARPRVVLYFDNWFGNPTPAALNGQSHHSVILPILNSYGWKCAVTIPVAEWNFTDNGGISYLQALEAQGHDVVCNDIVDRNFRNPNLDATAMTYDQARRDIAQNVAALKSIGITRGAEIFVWNYNSYNKAILDAARDNGIRLGRAGISERAIYHRTPAAPTAYEMLRVGGVSLDNMTSDQMIRQVQYCLLAGGDIHVYWHKFAAGGSASLRPSVNEPALYDSPPQPSRVVSYTAAFSAFAAWLRARQLEGLVDVMSPSQYLRSLEAPQRQIS